MSNIPADLRYTKEDEWIRIEGDTATIGITDYAQDQLSDIVYIELPDVDDTLKQGDPFGVVESVKAAADLYAPLTGTIVAVNDGLIDAPEAINDSPYDAWMLKVALADSAEIDGLLDAAGYQASIDERE